MRDHLHDRCGRCGVPARSSRKKLLKDALKEAPLSLSKKKKKKKKKKKQKKKIKNPFIFGPGSPDGKSGVVHPDRKISKRTIKFVKNPFIFGRPAGKTPPL